MRNSLPEFDKSTVYDSGRMIDPNRFNHSGLILTLLAWLLPAAAFGQYTDSTFRFFDFKTPATQADWTKQRADIQATLGQLFANIPPVPANVAVTTLSKEHRNGYTLEKFTFFNGVDATVPGYLLIPDGLTKPAPAVLYHHYHGGEYGQGKNELFKTNWVNGEGPGEGLVKQGYVVLCIDAYCFGERQGKGPGGPTEKGKDEELSWAKINLLKGRSLFGMMIHDDRMALTYLSSRPEIDPARIAAVGMSLGCLRSFWLAALDTRVKATVAVACLVRNQELIRNQRLNAHGIYYYIPDMLTKFDNESVVACIAPRPLLTLTGNQDQNAPVDGVQYINKAVSAVYRVTESSNRFKSVIYPGVRHEFTPPMWQETLVWLRQVL